MRKSGSHVELLMRTTLDLVMLVALAVSLMPISHPAVTNQTLAQAPPYPHWENSFSNHKAQLIERDEEPIYRLIIDPFKCRLQITTFLP